MRTLEAYTVWLERLPDADRQRILTVATPGERLAVVRDLRDRQCLAALPPAIRANPALVTKWREADTLRRDRWALARRQAEAFTTNKTPWPFDTAAGRREVVAFARATFKPNEPRRCRLTADELTEYRRTLAAAERDGEWAWYGLLVFELANTHPYLPEPHDRKRMYDEPGDLPDAYARVLSKKGGGLRVRLNSVGKWPDFPLEVHHLPFVKLFPTSPPLGPARVSEFAEPVRTFAANQFVPKLTADEKRDLTRLEGKWPDYPQRFLALAHTHDLSVPGVTLPGPPTKWLATYTFRPAALPPR